MRMFEVGRVVYMQGRCAVTALQLVGLLPLLSASKRITLTLNHRVPVCPQAQRVCSPSQR